MKIFSIFVLYFFALQQVGACTCTGPPTIKENWDLSSQIFIGQVVSLDTSGRFYTSDGSSVAMFNIRVLESFKNKINPRDSIRTFTSLGGGSCDSYFKNGQKYLIYAYGDSFDGFLKSSDCFRTTELTNVDNGEIEQLRKFYRETFALSDKYKSTSELEIYRLLEDRERELRLSRDSLKDSIKNFTLFAIICSIVISILLISLFILWKKTRKTLT
jgi:hypothetical protein